MVKNKILNFENEKIIKIRLGIRFKRLFLPLDLNTVSGMLQKLGYREINHIDEQQISANKSDANFYIDKSRLVLGFNARNIQKIITSQKDFFSLSDREYHTNLSEYVRFYELEYVVNYYSEKNTHDIIKNKYSNFNMISNFENITGQELIPKGVDLVSKNDPLHGDRLFQLVIEPKTESSAKVYFCKILYRDNSQNNIFAYAQKCSDVIKKSIQKLEE